MPPPTPAVDVAPILHKLLIRKRRRGLARVLGFVFGLPLLFLGPAVLGTMFWVACILLYQWYPWTWFFLGTCAVAIPALFVTEIRTAGEFMSAAITPDQANRAMAAQAVKTVGTLINPRLGNTLALAAAIASPRASTAGFVELFLTGPRLLLSAFRNTRMTIRLRSVDVERTALLLHQLLRANIGVPIQSLLQKSERPGDLELPLAYLVFHDWAAVAADHSKAWILSDAKKDLT